MQDPTRDAMLGLLARELPYADAWTKEPAIYWFAAEYHGGQGSNLYAALCASPYTPGWIECACPEDARKAYDLLVTEFGGS